MASDYSRFNRLLKFLIAILFAATIGLSFSPLHFSWYYWRQLILEWFTLVTVVLILSGLFYWIAIRVFPKPSARFGAAWEWNSDIPRRFVLIFLIVISFYFVGVFRIFSVYKTPQIACEFVINETQQLKIINFQLNNKYAYASRDFFLYSSDNGKTWTQFGHHAGGLDFMFYSLNDACKLNHSAEENRLWLEYGGNLLQADLNGAYWEFIEQ